MPHLTKKTDVESLYTDVIDMLYEIDISAYHPSLSCRLIDYDFATSDIHSHFATFTESIIKNQRTYL